MSERTEGSVLPVLTQSLPVTVSGPLEGRGSEEENW